ncbi:OppA family ABC transporter substrate-binding lipoprotein [Mycoplasmopsis columbinasalis]|uniref:Lipoprotein n=1 Tax=Mycoplasmopsis columbinasalis TaxID=114880 RepID=A0A449B9Q8_9BACT|nr:hypothetical protein [Mycoplasmopsis columbinasalis]VEU77930.1 Uncharacterised protein [Mycoplasmopsis columbinasalis]
MKKRNLLKSLVPLSTISVLSAVVAVSCGKAGANFPTSTENLGSWDETSSNSEFALNQANTFRADLNVTNFGSTGDYDLYSYYGSNSVNDYAKNATDYFVHKEYIGNPQFITRSTGSGASLELKYLVTRPSYSRYKLSLASAIVLNFDDGKGNKTTKVYDNDRAEIFNESEYKKSFEFIDAQGNKTTEDYWEFVEAQLTSDDPRSINNAQFRKDLKNKDLVNVQFVIRDDVKYVDVEGKWTNYKDQDNNGYKLQAEDIYNSLLLTFFSDTAARHKQGGNAFADELWRKLFASGASKKCSPTSHFPNAYVWKLYTADFNALLDRDQTLQNLSDDAQTKLKTTNDYKVKVGSPVVAKWTEAKELTNLENVLKNKVFTINVLEENRNQEDQRKFPRFDQLIDFLRLDTSLQPLPTNYVNDVNTVLARVIDKIFEGQTSEQVQVWKADFVKIEEEIQEASDVVKAAQKEHAIAKAKKAEIDADPKQTQAAKDAAEAKEKAAGTKVDNAIEALQKKQAVYEAKIKEFATWLNAKKSVLAQDLAILDQNINNYQGKKLSEIIPTGHNRNYLADFLLQMSFLDRESNAWKTGVYWLGTGSASSYVVGHYYKAPFDAANAIGSYYINQHYWEKDFVNNPNALQTINVYYRKSQADNPVKFSHDQFELFKDGKVSQLQYGTLSENDKKELEKNYSVTIRPNQIVNQENVLYRVARPLFFTFDSKKWGGLNGTKEFEFSDAYSLLMYGKTKKELVEQQVPSPTFFAGLGLAFRSVLKTSVNWYTLASNFSKQTRESFFPAMPADAYLYAEDDQYGTLNENKAEVNSLFVIDAQGNKVKLQVGNEFLDEISYEKMKAYALSKSTIEDKKYSPVAQQLKVVMKGILDKFFEENPTLKGQKIELKLESLIGTYSEELKESMRLLKTVFESLDSRIQVTLNLTNADTDQQWEERIDRVAYGGLANIYLGWNPDTDNVFSAVDGLSWEYGLAPALTYIYQITKGELKDDSKYDFERKVLENFPKIVATAEEFVQYLRDSYEGGDKAKTWLFEGVPVDKLHLIDTPYLKGEGFNKQFVQNDAGLYVQKADNPALTNEDGRDAFYTISANFWAQYPLNKKKEYLLGFFKEFSTFFSNGSDPTSQSLKTIGSFNKVVISTKYLVPFTKNSSFANWADWRINTPEEKDEAAQEANK